MSVTAEMEAQNFWRLHKETIDYVTMADCPWRNPLKFPKDTLLRYTTKMMGALAHPANHEHEKFVTSVKKFLSAYKLITEQCRPGGTLYDVASVMPDKPPANTQPSTDGCPVPPSMRPGKLGYWSTTLRCAIPKQSRAYQELKRLYSEYLAALGHLGDFRPSHYVDVRRDERVVDAIVNDIPLSEPKTNRRAFDKKRRDDGDDGDAENNKDDAQVDDVDDIPAAAADGGSVTVSPQAAVMEGHLSGLPAGVVHRWADADTQLSYPVLNTQMQHVGSLDNLIRRTFTIKDPSTGCDHADAPLEIVDVHAKMRVMHVVWLAPQEGAPYIETPFTTVKEHTKLAAIHAVAAKKTILDNLQPRCAAEDMHIAAYRKLISAVENSDYAALDAHIKWLDVESGKRRQREGAQNETRFWNEHKDLVVRQVVVPIHSEWLIHTGRGRSRPAMALAGTSGFQADVWIDKCSSMYLAADELEMVEAHPAYSKSMVEEDAAAFVKLHAKEQDVMERAEERRRFFQFRVFAQHIVQLPFYHFIDESALRIQVIDLRAAVSAKVARGRGRGYPRQSDRSAGLVPTWVNVGELDGMLVDLNTNTVLACFEIKANPADIGKAFDQGVRLGERLSAAFSRTVLGTPESNPAGHVAQLRVDPGSAPNYSKPYYDVIFPLSHENFAPRFSTPEKRLRSWFVITNIPTSTALSNIPFQQAAYMRPLPCEAGVWYMPSLGRFRHVVVEALALVAAQSWVVAFGDPRSTSSFESVMAAMDAAVSTTLPLPQRLDMGAVLAASNRIYGQGFFKSKELSPREVLDTYIRAQLCASIIWVEKPRDTESLAGL